MNYIDSVKQQVKLYVIWISYGLIAYVIARHFVSGTPMTITPNHISAFVAGTFSHIFLAPFYLKWFESLKNK